MRLRVLIAAIGLVAVPQGLGASASRVAPSGQKQVTPALREIQGQVLKSIESPAVKIKFDKAFKYAGSQDFILYDVARAEQHFFVDADKSGRIKRLYWIQFEGYLPTNTNTYKYKSPKIVNIGGFDFFADAFARNIKANPGRSDSDGARARSFLEAKNLRLPAEEVLSQRLVHLVDESKRSELMIIYMEDLTSLGFAAADLAPNGKSAGEWEGVSKALLDRARAGMQLSR